ncbi:flagellar M-ring protein FliF [Brevirhabdus pacifica]|uniref:Flagellar M-ring protein n=2 Tax=Brevirhabdus pacifica TaxID=1267768 RepID=A0A1U7DH41_9RHOB|nr:flagellar basal-body MS-ring/collar protein FliF [Brevirhabdus pacifica]APX89198.1 flagellar M-ring protein FliF [Brevirhabdus pacifica]OWU76752.1 flagellar M-ring protein FliF [Loktanella sp. 22II-4b]PJJ86200.1 flagellar M-ring protein FliF [Brevirhabdus pacifica]
MQSIIDNLRSLGRNRLMALAGTGIALVAALFLGMNLALKPTYVPLYSELSPTAAADVVATLESAGFAVELNPGGTAVSVAEGDLARARMALAEKGLPGEGVIGWEIFDQASGLGMNSYMQRVNRLRALEGELTRSIQTIEGVEAVRLHLVMPEREAFSRSRPEPSASVIVRGRGADGINRRNALAIRTLVASAVPDLDPGRVTVMSARGQTILGDESAGGGEGAFESARVAAEERLSRAISDILTARVGAGNARVEVNVDLSTERQIIRTQSFDPSQRVVRSTETREENVEGTDSRQGEVSVAGNIPNALGGQEDGTKSTNRRNKVDEIVNYEIGSTNTETIREAGEIERVTVAVLVNGIYNVADNGDVAYEERSPEELGRLTQLVQAAIGFDGARGDTVSVDSLRFMDYSMDLDAPVARGFSQILADNMMTILRGLLGLAVVALALIFGVRPILARISDDPMAGMALAGGPSGGAGGFIGDDGAQRREALPAVGGGQAGQGAQGGQGGEVALRGGSGGGGLRGTVVDDGDGEFGDEMINFNSSRREGTPLDRLASVGDLIESNPVEALKVLQAWLAEDE